MAVLAKRAWATFHRVFLNKPPALRENPPVIAAIPLISKEKSGDWETVCFNLARTVRSVLAQDYDNTEILICGQDEPSSLPKSEKIRFLKAPPMTKHKTSDKGQKIAFMARDLARRHDALVYLMFLDADDLLHPGLFTHVANDNNGRGYLIDKGYLFDPKTRDFAPLDTADRHSFDRHCGSCALFAADFSRPWVTRMYLSTFSRGHNKYAELSVFFGTPLAPVPFYAALYVINHGENARARRGVGDFKTKLLSTRQVDPGTARDVARTFGIDHILG